MLFFDRTGWDCDQGNHRWSIIINTAWDVYLFTSTMDIFLSKEPQFILQIQSGHSFVCFTYIFNVALDGSLWSLLLCPWTMPEQRDKDNTQAWYWWIKNNLRSDRLRAFSRLKLLRLHDPKFQGFHRGLRLRYGRSQDLQNLTCKESQ